MYDQGQSDKVWIYVYGNNLNLNRISGIVICIQSCFPKDILGSFGSQRFDRYNPLKLVFGS